MIFLCIIVWKEIVQPYLLTNESAMKQCNFSGACFELIGMLALLIPEEIEDYTTIDPAILDGLNYLKSSMAINPSGVLNALGRFPKGLLVLHDIDVFSMFREKVDRIDLDSIHLSSFLTKWIGDEIKEMPRSLFLGTSTKESVKKTTLVKIPSSWASNPLLAAIKLNMEPSLELLSQFYSLPSLTMQHWLLRFEFVSLLRSGINLIMITLLEDPKFITIIEEQSHRLLEQIKKGQIVATISYYIMILSLLVSEASSLDGNQKRIMEIITLFINGNITEDRFKMNEEIQASIVIGLGILLSSLDEASKCSISASLYTFLESLQPTQNSWLWLVKEYYFGSSWPSMIGQSCSVEATELIPRLFSNVPLTLEEFEEVLQAVERTLRTEPNSITGCLQYGLGRAAIRTIPPPKEWLERHLSSLITSGPAIKKIESCYTLAGYLGMALSAPSPPPITGLMSSEYLQRALQSNPDPRLQTWLLVLLFSTSELSSIPNVSPAGLNRFGEESPFGLCLSLLEEGTSLKDIILDVFTSLPLIPRIDWSWLHPDDDAFLRFAWGHCLTVQHEQRHVNKSLVIHLLALLEDTDSFVTVEQAKKLIECTISDAELSTRAIIALQPTLRKDPDTLTQILTPEMVIRHADIFLQIIEDRPLSVPLWLKIANVGLSVPFAVTLLTFLQTRDLDYAIDGYDQWSEIIKQAITVEELPELLSAYILKPNEELVISRMIMDVLITQAPMIAKECPPHDVLQFVVAWKLLQRTHPVLASKLSRRVAKIAPLLESDNPLLVFTR